MRRPSRPNRSTGVKPKLQPRPASPGVSFGPSWRMQNFPLPVAAGGSTVLAPFELPI
ncbi:hypothetical protein AMA2_38 [Achromobacter phage AMA2]|nr:hypothetical protein AMA2_38 [Achromobacter phage AMA2]